MIDFVLWSSVLALAPVALGVSWELASGIAGRVGHTLFRDSEDAEEWEHQGLQRFHPPSGRFAVSGGTLCPAAERIPSPSRRRHS